MSKLTSLERTSQEVLMQAPGAEANLMYNVQYPFDIFNS